MYKRDELYFVQLEKLKELAGGCLRIYTFNDLILCSWDLADPAYTEIDGNDGKLIINFLDKEAIVQNSGCGAWGGYFLGERFIKRLDLHDTNFFRIGHFCEKGLQIILTD